MALLGFQKSQWSTATTVRFTVNITVVGREDWATGRATWPKLPEPPRVNWGLPPMMQAAFEGYWHTRIGFLMPGGRDRWWNVEAGTAASDVAEAVVADIQEFAITAMRERMNGGDIANPS